MVTHTSWLSKLKTIVASGVEEGLFGTLSSGQVIRRLFRDAQLGWCNGIAECLSVDKLHGLPIVEMVRTTLAVPERVCFVQICYGFAESLRYPTSDQEHFFDLCNRSCLQGKTCDDATMRPLERHYVHRAISFWKRRKIVRCDSTRFMSKKFQLFHRYLKKNGCLDAIPRSLTIDTPHKQRKAVELANRIDELKREILGDQPPSPVCEITICPRESCDECAHLLRAGITVCRSLRISEIQCIVQRHIYSIFQDGDSVYRFDTETGLTQLPTTDAISMLEYVPDAKYRLS